MGAVAAMLVPAQLWQPAQAPFRFAALTWIDLALPPALPAVLILDSVKAPWVRVDRRAEAIVLPCGDVLTQVK